MATVTDAPLDQLDEVGNPSAPTPRCSATTAHSKQPCRMAPISGEDFCFAHATGDAAATQRQDARTAGGATRAAQFSRKAHATELIEQPPDWLALKSANNVCEGFAYVVRELLQGRLSARDASATTQALSALLGAMHVERIERRLLLVEGALGTGKDDRRK